MDAEPVTPDAFLIFCPEVAPRPSDRLQIRAIASFRFADRTHPWPIRAHPASLSNMLPFPTSSSHPRGGPKQRVQLCHRDVPTCAEHPKASLTSRFVSSGNLAGESLVWNATIALAKTCRSWFSLVKPLANETHHQNDRRHCDDTFPTGPPAGNQSSEDDRCHADTPAASGIPDPVSRVVHPNTATNLHRGKWPQRTMFACRLPRFTNPALRPAP